MPRVTTAPARKKRKKRLLKLAKGYWGARSKRFKIAKETVARALRYAYRDRRKKKSDFRALWNIRINAAVRAQGLKYSEFINKLKKNNIIINRKLLSELAVNHPAQFASLVKIAKSGGEGEN
jgi:large subunit ribosomal protein L20